MLANRARKAAKPAGKAAMSEAALIANVRGWLMEAGQGKAWGETREHQLRRIKTRLGVEPRRARAILNGETERLWAGEALAIGAKYAQWKRNTVGGVENRIAELYEDLSRALGDSVSSPGGMDCGD